MTTCFADDVAAFADGGCTAMEVWLTKLEKHLESSTIAATRELVAGRGITLAAASYQGGLLLSEGEQRQAHFDQFKRRLDLCQQMGIKILVVVADFVETVDPSHLQNAMASLRAAAQWAAGFDVRLALEFRGNSRFCSSLDTACALVEACGEENVGVNLDIFHYYTGPSKFEDFALLNKQNLAFVQISDLAGVARELAANADRVLPGDGDFDLRAIIDRLRALGYDGWISVELFNQTLWNTKPSQVAELSLMSLRRLLEAG
jgi:sugar phosphate isomerase/epimerase